MATNMIYKFTESDAVDVPSGTKSGDLVVVAGRVGVALTDRYGTAKTVTDAGLLPPGITSITYTENAPGLKAGQATVAWDGTWELPVTGATTSTAEQTLVYVTGAGALTLTAGSNAIAGRVRYPQEEYLKTAGVLPVRIGAL